jgi:hypothetical protein
MTRARKFTIATVATMGVVGGVILGCHTRGPKVPQPPIKIRGGAMTLRYPKINGNSPWFSYQNGYCTLLDTSSGKAELKVFQRPDPSEPSSMETDFPLIGTWSATLYALNDSGTAFDPQHGIKLNPVHDCNGSHKGVSVLPFGSNSDFYPGELPSHDGGIGKRYRRSAGCSDEDLCEHLGRVLVEGQSYKDCEDGECLVKLVAPPV